MKTLSFLCTLCFMSFSGISQNTVMIHQGEIEFERRVNAYAILNQYYINDETHGSEFAEQYKSNNPQFKVNKFVLSFNDNLSYYSPSSIKESEQNLFLSSFAGSNIIYTDFVSNVSSANKNVFGVNYVVTDSVRKIQWKITDEIKEIAGYSCRRANALIMDSVYVVAFYTDEIIPRGGPESFNGLPGMILGVALPHEHVTWFATKVSVKQIPKINFEYGKEKLIDNKELFEVLTNDVSVKMDLRKRSLYFHTILL